MESVDNIEVETGNDNNQEVKHDTKSQQPSIECSTLLKQVDDSKSSTILIQKTFLISGYFCYFFIVFGTF